MYCGMIDIGSNTIRLVIYESRAGEWLQRENVADYAGLISDVSDGKISEEGIGKIISALNGMKEKCAEWGCEKIYAFATASLRDIADQAGLRVLILEKTGIEIHFISGMEEAWYDYMGLQSQYQLSKGIAFDLGGGSCQMAFFEYQQVPEYGSMKIGSLRLYDEFVAGDFPTAAEMDKLRRKVRRELADFALCKGAKFPEIFGMGGAARAALKLQSYLTPMDEPFLTTDQMRGLMQIPEEIIRAVIPERAKTILPAVLTMLEICRYTNAKAVHVTDCGVREGLLNALHF